MDQGDDIDALRMATRQMLPRRDQAGQINTYGFGSAHASTISCAFCDGSVQRISYDIDADTHFRLGSRNDGLTIDRIAF